MNIQNIVNLLYAIQKPVLSAEVNTIHLHFT